MNYSIKFCFVAVLFCCSFGLNGGNNSVRLIKQDDKWYLGGNLHSVNVSIWKSATAKNRLATCADYVAASKKASGKSYKNMADLKTDAIEMLSCINEAVKGEDKIYKGMKTNEIAALCAVLLKM